MTEPSDTLLSATAIANAAGVGQSAVSNWRKRHADFPTPVPTDDGRELFRLSEVNKWLQASGRSSIEFSGQDQLWNLVAAMRGDWTIQEALEGIVAGLVLRDRLARASKAHAKLSDDLLADTTGRGLSSLLEKAGLMGHEDAFRALASVASRSPILLEAFDSVELEQADLLTLIDGFLARWDDIASPANEHATSASIARLLARIAAEHLTASPGANRRRLPLVLDPTIGLGTTVTTLLSSEPPTSGGRAPFRVCGQDVNGFACSIARLRLIAQRVQDPEVQQGDSLQADAFPGLAADLVIADPPFNQRSFGWEEPGWAHDPRWRYAPPDPRDATGAWIQHVAEHVAPDGHGFVVVPQGALFGRRSADLRRALVADNRIAGVIALPAGVGTASSVRTSVLVLLGAEDPTAPGSVYFVDATNEAHLAARTGRQRQLDAEAIEAIAQTICGIEGRGPAPSVSIPHMSVPTPEILADPEGSLLPQRWVETQGPSTATIQLDYDRAVARWRGATSRLHDHPGPLAIGFQAGPDSRSVRISDLVKTGAAEILRPGRLDRSDYVESGTPVLTQSSLRRDGAPPEFERFVDLDGVPEQVLTQPGDVILATVGERPYAVVDRTGGAVLGQGLEALRLTSSFDPQVVAAVLSSSRSRRAVTGSTIPRVRLRDLAIPALSPECQSTAANALDRLAEIEAIGKEIAATAAEARSTVVESVAAGTEITMMDGTE